MRHLLTIFALLVTLTGCSSNTEFKGQQNNDFQIDDDIDKNPTSVNADPGDNEVDLQWLNNAPEGFWRPATDDFTLRDTQTGTLWNLRGEAYDGPLAGLRLQLVPSFNAFWFAWSVFHHGAEVFGHNSTNSTSDVTADGECLVPCDEIRLACGGGKDCIPALDYDGVDGRPTAKMVSAGEAEYLDDGDFVFGVVINGEARAYPHNVFWWHEIYNDKIGDQEFSVTFCPLTGSGIVFAGTHDGEAIDFGVSGNLYNSNLVMFDRQTDTLWSQMLLTGISGTRRGEALTVLPIVETTWLRWRQMYPNTRVASDDQGYSRNYNSYPYGDYRTDHSDTFRPTNPPAAPTYDAKDRTLGVLGETPKLYAFEELESLGDRVVVNDQVDGRPVVIIYEAQHRMALSFSAVIDGETLTFEGATAP